MLDGVAIERAGVPAAVVITDEFGATAQVMLENQGAPWFPFVEVSHPINVLSDEQLAELAANAVDAVARLLTGD